MYTSNFGSIFSVVFVSFGKNWFVFLLFVDQFIIFRSSSKIESMFLKILVELTIVKKGVWIMVKNGISF